MDLFGANGNAFNEVGKGISNIANGIGEGLSGASKMVTSALTLDFKGVAKGAKQLTGAVTDVTKDIVNMTPVGMAANTLLDGALDKALERMDDLVDNAADAAIDSVANSAESVNDGVVATAEGVLTGDLIKADSGILNVASGAAGLIPSQIALNAAASAAGSVLSDVIPGKAGEIMGGIAGAMGGSRSLAEAGVAAGTSALMSSGVLDKLADIIPGQADDMLLQAGGALLSPVNSPLLQPMGGPFTLTKLITASDRDDLNKPQAASA